MSETSPATAQRARPHRKEGEARVQKALAPPSPYRCSMLYRLAIVSVEVAPAQTRTLSIFPGK